MPKAVWCSSLTAADTVIAFQAANFLDIKGLLDLTCQAMADMIKGRSPEEIRKTFDMMNDFSPEEEEEIIRDNQWALQWWLLHSFRAWKKQVGNANAASTYQC